MKWLKTDFSRIHAAAAAAAVVTLALGAGLRYGGLAYEPFGDLHGIAGASIFGLFLLLPLLFKKRASLYRALKAKLFISRRDRGNVPAIAAKVVAQLLALVFLFQLLTGALIATGLAYLLFPTFAIISFHASFLWALLALAILHPTLMLLTRRFRNRR